MTRITHPHTLKAPTDVASLAGEADPTIVILSVLRMRLEARSHGQGVAGKGITLPLASVEGGSKMGVDA